jgi:hypothetical protein
MYNVLSYHENFFVRLVGILSEAWLAVRIFGGGKVAKKQKAHALEPSLQLLRLLHFCRPSD